MATHTPVDPTGEQIRLRRGDVTARITQVGAALRELTVGGSDLIAGYPDGTRMPGASGIVLAPWPNRVRDGRWTHEGAEQQLPLTEPKFRNASHGLLRFAPYAIEHGASEATLRATIFPQNGYPFAVETAVTYALTDDGIRVTHTLRNVGSDAAPVAVGAHPYLTVGDADPSDLVVTGRGATWLETDGRMLPIAEHEVGEATDLREGRPLSSGLMDRCYANLVRDDDGLARTTLTAPDGRATTLWQDDGLDYTHVFITDGYPGRPLAVAIEPMSAPADAFNSGRGLRSLAPGEEWSARWGIVAA
ncbi:MAG: aldose 1-epimerase family protein [Microbacterium sp.]